MAAGQRVRRTLAGAPAPVVPRALPAAHPAAGRLVVGAADTEPQPRIGVPAAGGVAYTRPVLVAARSLTRDGGTDHCPRKALRPPREPASHLRPPGSPNQRRAAAGDVYPGPRHGPGPFHVRSAAMPATVIVGLQWGDEGKGKTTDFLAEQTAMVVRYQGGDNAGHTVVVGDEVVKLQLCPSGVLYPHITSVIGNGVVVNPATLIRELDMLAARGIDVSRVRVSRSAHVIMPYHVALDKGNETRLADAKVGTTGRGIGPAYGDRAWRLGLRMEDLCDEPVLRERIGRALVDKNLILRAMGSDTFEVEPLVSQALTWAQRLRPHLDDSTWLVQDALRRGDHVLLEGAQGTLLDLDHGSYPFVTSSNPVAGGACTGGGI